MAWINVVPEEEADGELRAVYEAVTRSRGKLSNILKVHSLNPAALSAHLELYLTVMFGKSKLRRAEREMMATAVSAVNRCPYCVHHHAEALSSYWKGDRKTEHLVRDLQDTEGLTDRERSLVRYAVLLTRDPAAVTPATVEGLRTEGLTDSEILDATLIVGYFNFVNRIALGLGVEFTADELGGYKY